VSFSILSPVTWFRRGRALIAFPDLVRDAFRDLFERFGLEESLRSEGLIVFADARQRIAFVFEPGTWVMSVGISLPGDDQQTIDVRRAAVALGAPSSVDEQPIQPRDTASLQAARRKMRKLTDEYLMPLLTQEPSAVEKAIAYRDRITDEYNRKMLLEMMPPGVSRQLENGSYEEVRAEYDQWVETTRKS